MIVINIKPILGVTLYKKYNAHWDEHNMVYWMIDDFNYRQSYLPEYFNDLDTYRYEKLKEIYE